MKKIDWKKIKLTKEEQEIEDEIHFYRPLSAKNRKLVDAALAQARKEKKEATISLRMTEQDLWEVKQRAAQEGLPYQTLISSIIHKYMTHQFLDEKQVRKVVQTLRQR
jgi:predicted DNA binding CopG/RHH family protein